MSADLPIPDYDGLPLTELQSRLRTLDEPQLSAVLAYERTHAARPAVLIAGQHRLTELHAGVEPSGGAPNAPRVAAPAPPDGGSPVSPQTQGPKQNPPSQGVPSNPAQPR